MRCLNDPDHQKRASVYHPLRWCCVYCNKHSQCQWSTHQRDPSVPPGRKENCVCIQTKCHCQQCKIAAFGHKSSYSVFVYHWCVALRSVFDGMTFPLHMERKKNADLWEEAWTFRLFLNLFYYSRDFFGRVDWQSEFFQKAAAGPVCHCQPDPIRSHSTVRDKFCSIEWCLKQGTGGQEEARRKRAAVKDTVKNKHSSD